MCRRRIDVSAADLENRTGNAGFALFGGIDYAVPAGVLGDYSDLFCIVPFINRDVFDVVVHLLSDCKKSVSAGIHFDIERFVSVRVFVEPCRFVCDKLHLLVIDLDVDL